jgi:hypothetical protein
MGTEALWVPLVLSAVGTAASVANTRSVARGQDRQAAAGIRKQAENQRAINERVNQSIQQTAQAKPEETRSAVTDGYLQQVMNAQAKARTGIQSDPGLSSAYNAATGVAGNQMQGEAANTASLFGRMDAPGVQRQQEGFRLGNLGMDLDVQRGNVGGDEYLNRLRMMGVQRNPWLDAAAGLASGAAAGMSSGGASGGYGPGYSATNTGTIAPIGYQNRNPWALPIYTPGGP